MQREFDKLDVDLKFMNLAIKIFEPIEAEIKKGVSIADLNRLTRTALAVQKGVDSWDIMRRADTSKDMIEKYYYPRSQRDEKLKDFLRF